MLNFIKSLISKKVIQPKIWRAEKPRIIFKNGAWRRTPGWWEPLPYANVEDLQDLLVNETLDNNFAKAWVNLLNRESGMILERKK